MTQVLFPFFLVCLFVRGEGGEVLKAFINMCHPLLPPPSASGVLYSKAYLALSCFLYFYLECLCIILFYIFLFYFILYSQTSGIISCGIVFHLGFPNNALQNCMCDKCQICITSLQGSIHLQNNQNNPHSSHRKFWNLVSDLSNSNWELFFYQRSSAVREVSTFFPINMLYFTTTPAQIYALCNIYCLCHKCCWINKCHSWEGLSTRVCQRANLCL